MVATAGNTAGTTLYNAYLHTRQWVGSMFCPATCRPVAVTFNGNFKRGAVLYRNEAYLEDGNGYQAVFPQSFSASCSSSLNISMSVLTL
jgi:hypothetical protein